MKHYIEILQQLGNNSIILTPNRRLALFLQAAYQRCKLAEKKSCWETPLILPVNVWIDELWNEYSRKTLSALPHILNASQEQILWETILTGSSYQNCFLQVSDTARLVKSARGLLKQWQVSTAHPLFATAEDYLAFTAWEKEFEAACSKHQWLDAAQVPDLIRELIAADKIPVPAEIYHAGFAELSPQLSALFTAAESKGCKIKTVSAAEPANNILRTEAQDTDDELRLCAEWARKLHEKAPQDTIACVIPQLDHKRNRVLQIFNEIFGGSEAFNISAGQPLSHYPVIHAALELLALSKKQITSEALFFILSTPFIGDAEKERMRRCQFDGSLRAKNYSSIDLEAQIADTEEGGLQLIRHCPLLGKRFRAFKALLDASPASATFSEWAGLFNRLLGVLGWPGERILNSEEYQVVEEWLKLLQDMTTLDVTTPQQNYYQALQILKGMAAAKPFQPKTPPANVQILGVLEAAGLCFDHLWISGMDDHAWPAQPSPNPFIPKQLQRELKMPHASAERELEYCNKMTQQFQSSAGTVIFSYAKMQDENIAKPSPLIRAIAEISSDEILPERYKALSEIIFQNKSLEKFSDAAGPAYQTDEIVRGGVDIIKNQALCPFKAFAECRLQARELENPLPGLRAKERGTIVHQVMEKFWDSMKDSEKLLASSDEELHGLLEDIINAALEDHASAVKKQNSYLALEKQRLLKLTFDWLMKEKTRSPFAVLSSEKNTEVTLGNLKFNVRIDRIDLLPNGKKLVIDYKSSDNYNVGNWFDERPDDPQLPLYAQIDSINTAGLAYAVVATGKHAFKGISQYELDINGIKPSDESRQAENKPWAEVTANWNSILMKLGNDFYQGQAQVDPKSKSTCQYCALKPLCRIHETGGEFYDE